MRSWRRGKCDQNIFHEKILSIYLYVYQQQIIHTIYNTVVCSALGIVDPVLSLLLRKEIGKNPTSWSPKHEPPLLDTTLKLCWVLLGL